MANLFIASNILIWSTYCTRTFFCVSSCNDLAITNDSMIVSGKAASSYCSCSTPTGHVDHHLRIWDMKSNDCLRDIDNIHENQITSVCLSPDGATLLTNSKDNTLQLVDTRTFEVRSTLKYVPV